MRAMRLIALAFIAPLVAGCVAQAPTPTSSPAGAPAPVQTSRAAANSFVAVVNRVEPVAEQVCRQRRPGANCDFKIIVDSRPGVPPNAFQTLDDNGRPIIGFTASLIEDARNGDELAFILGHEAAHHIQGHIPKTQQTAVSGAVLLGVLAALGGADAGAVQTAQDIGATVGARAYSKEFELEADSLGTVIAAQAGYNPVNGARYFERIDDPGNQFLGTHPPNAERIATVRRTAAGL